MIGAFYCDIIIPKIRGDYMGILICGLNGAGKSTLGKVLAEKLNFHFIDIEDLYFDKNTSDNTYQNPHTRDEVINLLNTEVKNHPDFVLSAVKGDFSDEFIKLVTDVFLLEVPKEVRMKRIYDRSYEKFGARMLLGGDLYESENKFFELVKSRPEDYAERWLQGLNKPVIKLDGTKQVEENIEYILNNIS